MNDAIKHTTGTAFTAICWWQSVTLERVNAWVALVCGILGCIAAICTIHSWWKAHHKKPKK